MSGAIAAVAVGTIAGAYIASQGAQGAAQTQANAQQQATAAQEAMFNKQFAAGAAWRQSGRNALGQIQGMDPYFNHQFNASDLTSNLAPNYKFMLNQGEGAMQNAANKSGGLISGNSLRSLNNYAQNYAQNGYQQAYDNYTNNQTNIFNRLSTIAGLGQQSSTASATGAPSFSSGIAQSMGNTGTALGAGQAASANAWSNAANTTADWYGASTMASSPPAAASTSLQSTWGNG